MRLITGLFFAFMLSVTVSAKGQTSGRHVIQSSVVCSHCAECSDCAPNIRKALFALKGVRDFSVNTQNQTITVFYKPKKVELAAIREAIAKIGFKADELQADPVAYARLDACCKLK